jgi:hypothetical protein
MLLLCWPWHAWNDHDKSWAILGSPCSMVDLVIFNKSTPITLGNGDNADFEHSSWIDDQWPKNITPDIYATIKRKSWKVSQALQNLGWISYIEYPTGLYMQQLSWYSLGQGGWHCALESARRHILEIHTFWRILCLVFLLIAILGGHEVFMKVLACLEHLAPQNTISLLWWLKPRLDLGSSLVPRMPQLWLMTFVQTFFLICGSVAISLPLHCHDLEQDSHMVGYSPCMFAHMGQPSWCPFIIASLARQWHPSALSSRGEFWNEHNARVFWSV